RRTKPPRHSTTRCWRCCGHPAERDREEAMPAEKKTGPGAMIGTAGPGMLAGLRVAEVADELAEYTGLLLAGLGADVVKIEPPGGAPTRRIGPFLDDQPHPERS